MKNNGFTNNNLEMFGSPFFYLKISGILNLISSASLITVFESQLKILELIYGFPSSVIYLSLFLYMYIAVSLEKPACCK